MKTNFKKTIYTLLIVTSISSYTLANATNKNPIEPEKKLVKISGKVIDQKTSEVLAGVKIYFLNSNKFVYTDFDGKFIIEEMVSEDAELSASLISYENVNIKIDYSKSVTLELKRQK